MSASRNRAARGFRVVVGGVLAAAVWALLATPAEGDLLGNLFPYVTKVEENWSVLVNQPDSNRASPQVSTQMARSPYAARFCNFHINSCDVPTFSIGGWQLQVWKGSTNLTFQNSPNQPVMATNNELVTWTQYIRRNGSSLYFGISAA